MAGPTRWEEIVSTVDPPTWRDLLRELNAELLGNEEIAANLPAELVESGWLGRLGATAAVIEAAEQRIGVSLPPSYRAFLAESNGWRCLNWFEVALLSVGEIDWLRVVDPYLVEIWSEYPKSDSPTDQIYFTYGADQPVFRAEHIRDMLVISDCGSSNDDYVWLNPRGNGPDGEWEAWSFNPGSGQAQRHRSFRDLMLEILRTAIHDRFFP